MPVKDDFDLQSSNLQALSSRDEVAALFTRLGYNTNARLTQTAGAMGLTGESLKRDVRHIERIADHEDGALQVYLAELKSVTVAHTQALARAMRNRAGDFLWVLTSDYQRLDFVLMERLLPEGQPGGGISTRGVVVRPRVLTVDRRNPGPVELRVLRRFSYTEADADYQIQKLKSAYTIAEWSEPLFNNRALFSDYYLNVRLKDTPEWNDASHMAPALRQLQGTMVDVRRRVTGQPEDVTRRTLIEPALKALGFDLKPGKHSASNAGEPDYFLQPAGADQTVAFCLAYVWARSLDSRVEESVDPKTADENPGALIVSLLDRDDAPDWAIVTNGKTWRLYSRQAHSRATNYYEIDLEETLASPDPGLAFRYFWLFFNAAAFAPDAQRAGKPFLSWLLDECNLYARELEERLKDRVFGEIFPHFARGFVEHMGGSDALLALSAGERAQRLNDVHHATLTFLYRLLFLLYAEARNLLPVKETRDYYQISLTRLKEEIARHAGTIEDEVEGRLQKAYRAGATGLYDRLLQLFKVIDRGDPDVNVPIYNGGLFVTIDESSLRAQSAKQSPASVDIASSHTTLLAMTAEPPEAQSARFLQQHKIPDRFLAAGLDRMARLIDPKRGDLVFIDYKSLGVRQLGSIYEGLLEFKLRVATEKMAVVRGKKADEIIPYAEAKTGKRAILKRGRGRSANEWTLPRGEVYLENDRRERKATGSYYTPDYIVKYIVRHTVGPVLDEKFEAITPRIRQAQKRFHNAVERKLGVEKVSRDRLDQPGLLNDIAGDVLRDLFDVKVLDPAMGSGHFLVEAVDFITDRMVQFMNRFVFLSHFFAGTRRAILDAMEQQEVTIDRGRLTDVNLLKRHVLKRCIYGVDLNPMAVELAKVSLWLDCFTLGAPLSFLDHHLKWGNSLIGAMAREADRELQGGESPQMTFLTGPFVGLLKSAEIMLGISGLSDATVTQVHESASLYRQFEAAAEPYKQLLDVFVIRHFDVDGADEFLLLYGVDVMKADQAKLGKTHRAVLEERKRLFDQHHFFHWDLEFPEVFIDLEKADWKANGGFDAAIGNPPYANAWLMTSDDPGTRAAVESLVNTTNLLEGHWDLYAAFMVRVLHLVRQGGWHSFIVPDALLREKYAAALRRLLLTDTTIDRLMHFEGTNVFDEVSRHCVVYALKIQPSHRQARTKVESPLSGNLQQTEIVGELPQVEWLHTESTQIRVEMADPITRKISSKVFSNSLRVGQFCYVMVGATTHSKDGKSFRKSDIVTDEKVGNAHRFFDGKTLSRYEIEWDGRYIDYRQKEMYGPRYPELFESEKVVVRDVTEENERLVVSFDPEGLYCDHLVTCVVYYESMKGTGAELNFEGYSRIGPPYPSLKFLTAVLASKLMTVIFRLHYATGTLQGNYSHTYPQQVRAFPIRRIAFSTSAERRAELAENGRKLYARCFTDNTHAPILAFVDERLSAQPEESDIVHDLLAFLAEQMIDLNKRKQTEQKRFLGWLEGALKIKPDNKGNTGLDALSGKTTIRNYLGDYQKGEEPASFDDIENVLFKNRSRLGASLNDARLVAKLRSEYEKSLAVLLPIKRKLAWTDRLIDLVVYRLYGLTEEEISVVEGSQRIDNG